MSWLIERERLQAVAHSFDRSIKLKTKDNWICHAIAWLLFVCSFGKFKRSRFLTVFATTLGNYIFFPKEWSVKSVEYTLLHEAEHVAQFRRMGLWIHPLMGLPVAMVVFLLLPFPFLFAFGRFYMELGADKAKWRYLLKHKIWIDTQVIWDAHRRASSLASVDYLWALHHLWAQKLYIKAANKVIYECKT